jgi:cytochrome c6
MSKRIAAIVAVLAISVMFMEGCKKKTPEKTETPQTAPAAETAAAPPAQANSGEALFKKHCAVCHPDGGNIINPKKPLHAAALASANITKPADIVKIMRNPGPGMTKFDATTIADADATAIAEYVLKAFK